MEMFHSQIKCIIVRYLKVIMKYPPQAHTYENTHTHIYVHIQIGAKALCLNLKQTEGQIKFLYFIMNKKKD